jgi:hypothetical protein
MVKYLILGALVTGASKAAGFDTATSGGDTGASTGFGAGLRHGRCLRGFMYFSFRSEYVDLSLQALHGNAALCVLSVTLCHFLYNTRKLRALPCNDTL